MSQTKLNYIYIYIYIYIYTGVQKYELVASNKHIFIFTSTLDKKLKFDNYLFNKNEFALGMGILSLILLRKDKVKSTNDWSSFL